MFADMREQNLHLNDAVGRHKREKEAMRGVVAMPELFNRP
jgi:hypothetical protein